MIKLTKCGQFMIVLFVNMFLASLLVSFFIYHIFVTDKDIKSVNTNVDDLEVKMMKAIHNQDILMKELGNR